MLFKVGLRQSVGLLAFNLCSTCAMLSDVGRGLRFGLFLVSGSSLGGVTGFFLPTAFPTRELFGSSQKTTLHSTMSTTTPASPGAVSLVQPARKGELFDWNKQWYPILSLADADPGRAHAVQLLGKDLVLWRDNEDHWTCFDDRCPHRAAPLTEGRVESDGSLLCAYHAWRFDADGKCLSIPQSDRGGKDEAQPKACAKVYPTQVAQGVIWIWGENGPDSALESAVTPAALTPDLLDEEGVKSGTVVDVGASFTDIAYGWETFMENVVDASHVPASHHGIAGSRYDDVRPLHFQLDTEWPVTPTNGFRYKFFDAPTGTHNKCTFLPPNLAINENCDPDAGTIKLYLHATPTVPGWCRIVTRQVFVYPHPPKSKEAKEQAKENKRRGKKKTQFASTATITRMLPAWVLHPLGNLFLYQDLVFLHHQEKILASAGYNSSNYGKAVFVPASSDQAVMHLRKWITEFGSGGPAWDKGCDPALPPREHNRDALFNVYENHTKKCSTCLRALKNVKRALTTAKTSAVLSFAWAILRGARAVAARTTAANARAAVAVSGTTTAASVAASGSVLNLVTARAMLPAVALMFASLWSAKMIRKFHDLFYICSYSHQDNP